MTPYQNSDSENEPSHKYQQKYEEKYKEHMTYSPRSEEEPKNYFDKFTCSNSISIDVNSSLLKASCEFKFGKVLCKYPLNQKKSDKFTIQIIWLGKGLWIGVSDKDA